MRAKTRFQSMPCPCKHPEKTPLRAHVRCQRRNRYPNPRRTKRNQKLRFNDRYISASDSTDVADPNMFKDSSVRVIRLMNRLKHGNRFKMIVAETEDNSLLGMRKLETQPSSPRPKMWNDFVRSIPHPAINAWKNLFTWIRPITCVCV